MSKVGCHRGELILILDAGTDCPVWAGVSGIVGSGSREMSKVACSSPVGGKGEV